MFFTEYRYPGVYPASETIVVSVLYGLPPPSAVKSGRAIDRSGPQGQKCERATARPAQ